MENIRIDTIADGREMIRPYGPGKFDSIVDSAVYDAVMDGCDDELGDVEPFGWYGLMIGLSGITSEGSGEPLNRTELALLASHAAAILTEDAQGFVYVDYYETEALARAMWEAIEANYNTYMKEIATDNN